MNLFENYLKASFRGIEFFLDDGSMAGGRKTVKHEYVNSNRRFVEDLGENPKIYFINAFVFGKNGAGGIAERDTLINALDQKGPGLLVHPDYGNIEVVAPSYSVQMSRRTMGRYDFSLEFDVQQISGEPFIIPTRGIFGNTISQQQTLSSTSPVALTENTNLATKSQLASLAEEAREVSSESAQDIFVVPTDQNFLDQIEEVYTDAIEKIKTVAESIEDEVLKSTSLTNINKLLVDPPAFLSDPSVLFPELRNIYNQIASAGAYNNWIEAGEDFIELFSFGNPDTKRSGDLNRTYGSLVSNFQVNAYLNATESAATTDFSTVNDLEEAESKLDDLYQEAINDPLENSVILNTDFPDLKKVILETRSTIKNIFTQKEQNVLNIRDFNSNQKGFLLVSYVLYKNLDNLEVIFNLNENINASHPQSNMQVVEEFS